MVHLDALSQSSNSEKVIINPKTLKKSNLVLQLSNTLEKYYHNPSKKRNFLSTFYTSSISFKQDFSRFRYIKVFWIFFFCAVKEKNIVIICGSSMHTNYDLFLLFVYL